MTVKTKTTIHQAFSQLYDPRQAEKVEHPLINIVFMAVCGILCGANNWTQISEFGKAQQEWFEEILEMPNGIPSHDTFGILFGLLWCDDFSDKKAPRLRCSYSEWVRAKIALSVIRPI